MAASVVASTVVSSRMLAAIAASHGARHVETLTGFKWLARADAGRPARTLVYAYEEAIGHCVDPAAVRDKDGISAAVLVCDLVVALRRDGRTLLDALDELALATRRARDGRGVGARRRRRDGPPPGGAAVARRRRAGGSHRPAGPAGSEATDAVIYAGASVRVAVRPSGTEPKVKAYLEVRLPPRDDLTGSSRRGGPTAGRDPGRGGRVTSARTELTVPCVAETRHDVGDVVEPVVDRRGVEP